MTSQQFRPSIRKIAGGLVLAYFAILFVQIFPGPIGFLFTLIGPILLPGILTMLMVFIALYAMERSIDRKWLWLPGLFYGAYFALYLVSLYRAEAEINWVEAENNRQKIATEGPVSVYTNWGGDSLLWDWEVEAIYWKSDEVVDVTYFAVGNECDPNNPVLAEDDMRITRPRPESLLTVEPRSRRCLIKKTGVENSAIYEIDYDRRDIKGLINDWGKEAWKVTDRRSGETIAIARETSVRALSPIPLMYFGCTLVGPSFLKRCGLQFNKGHFRSSHSGPKTLPEYSIFETLARVLSLERRPDSKPQ